MVKIYVHDFYFDDFDISGEKNFCTSVNVYYNFSPEDPGDGWDNLEHFNITVASPYGLAEYLDRCIRTGLSSETFFFPYILFSNKYDKEDIMRVIKKELESLYGKTENEIVLKAIRKFSWEYEGIPEVYNKLFST